ncbi:MAG: TlyA family RNA methyltransferase, partial [Syntrophales bacterium]|nr:TlyA family RNA methyltransferase [Syntrophales bacterium]
DVAGMTALDVGASTGGFTDCLLQEGASRVYALDVGYGQLAWKLRQDHRVVVIERTNIRHYDGRHLTHPLDLAVIDVSFISLKLVLPVVCPLLKVGGLIMALVKPQFEVGREHIGKGGVVRDRTVQESALTDMVHFCSTLGLLVRGTCESPLRGPAGNREFFLLAEKSGAHHGD